jgi:threonine dehydrogenase-like Zn-dependent dehydrogenase
MSSHKAAIQGSDHKRVPADIAENPVIIGHEFCGTLLEIGRKWRKKFRAGQRYTIQPAMSYPGRELEAPGYSFRYIGGSATRVVIPREILEMDCLLPYRGDAFFKGSLSEPVSCIIGACNTQYHYRQGEYAHEQGIVSGGNMALLAGAGPMGLGARDSPLHGPRKPGLLTVTDIDDARLRRAAALFSPSEAARAGVKLHYCNTAEGSPVELMMKHSGGAGYDDVFVYAPVPALIEQASKILRFNGCLNFFAGPSRKEFYASVNFYDIHYMGHHVVGSSGGNTDDMRQAVDLMGRNVLNPGVMITHVGGLDAVVDTTMNLPSIPGGKKLIYTGISMPLTAIADFEKRGESDPLLAELARITAKSNGMWSTEAEECLLARGKPIGETAK